MTAPSIGLDDIDRLTGGRLGEFNIPCPLCSHLRHSAKNRTAKVLKVWRLDPGFATFCCVHCGEAGYTLRPQQHATGPGKARQGEGRSGGT